MKKYILGISLIILIFSSSALARNKSFGIGVIVGAPTGLSCKNWLNSRAAIDFAAAWSFGDRKSYYIHSDYLFHRHDLVSIENLKFIVSYGFGGRIKYKEGEDDNDTLLGIRIPVGLAYILKGTPF